MKIYEKPIIELTELREVESVMLSLSNGIEADKDTKVLSPGFRFDNPFEKRGFNN